MFPCVSIAVDFRIIKEKTPSYSLFKYVSEKQYTSRHFYRIYIEKFREDFKEINRKENEANLIFHFLTNRKKTNLAALTCAFQRTIRIYDQILKGASVV